VLPILLYSAILHKFIGLEKEYQFRFRLNVLERWKFGYFKSAILERTGSILAKTFRIEKLTSSTSAAIRGSFKDGNFYVPELLLNDILIMGELTAILSSDKDTIAQLMNAIEEADVRVALIKASKIPQSQILKMEKYGAEYKDERLCYRNECIIWSATHTIDNISEKMRDALLSRFFVIYIPDDKIPTEYCAYNNYVDKIDRDLEYDLSEWFYSVYMKDHEPDFEFASKVALEHQKQNKERDIASPRLIGDLKRMAIAHHIFFPDHTVNETLTYIGNLFDKEANLTSRQLIANFIYNNPKTFDEIERVTGLRKANLFNHFKRMGVLSTGSRPKYYYLDSFPKNLLKKTKELKQ